MENNTILIVSGLPRSGTSMMMQMIAKSGITILTDELRVADHSNPKGYYEFEPVKSLAKDNSWMDQAQGKCVKIIAQLLPFIRKEFQYKVIYMDRNLDEVLKSQNVMLGKGDQPVNPVIADVFKKQVASVTKFLQESPNIETLTINYRESIEDPAGVAKKVAEFIGKPEMEETMSAAVSKDLYRNKIG